MVGSLVIWVDVRGLGAEHSRIEGIADFINPIDLSCDREFRYCRTLVLRLAERILSFSFWSSTT